MSFTQNPHIGVAIILSTIALFFTAAVFFSPEYQSKKQIAFLILISGPIGWVMGVLYFIFLCMFATIDYILDKLK